MKKIMKAGLSLVLIFVLVSCTAGEVATTAQQTSVQTYNVQSVETTSVVAAGAGVESVATSAMSVERSETHDEAGDYTWDESSVVPITLNGDSATAYSQDVNVDNQTVTITAAGSYGLSGSLVDGQVIVDTDGEGVVRLILNGVNLHNTTGSAIYISKAAKVILILAESTENIVSDEETYVFEDPDSDEPNAAIFSKADLTIFGSGSLTVTARYNDGISSKDGLVIASGTVRVNAVDDGIRGKDYLVIRDGDITVNALGDGLKSDNAEDATKGYIAVDRGWFTIIANGDAIDAATDVTITGGDFSIASGGGRDGLIYADTSAKGIKAGVQVTIEDGSFTIDSADDGVHSNDTVTIHGGTFNISTGDDGVHADSTLDIRGGSILITQSYEGLESAVITIYDGDIDITATDDGINVAGGNDGSGMMNPGPAGGGRQRPGGGGAPGGGPGQDAFKYSGNNYLYIHGGTIVINAAGDGLDINGAVEMTDGIVIVSGPTEQMNGALDYDGGFDISGGLLIAAGSSGMAQAPGSGSSQYSALVFFDSTLRGGMPVSLQSDSGEEIFTFVPAKDYQSIVFSSPALAAGTTYHLYTGGSASGAQSGGLLQAGTYSPGTLDQSFTISSIVTQLGSGGNRRP